MSEIPPVFISYARDAASGQALARELYQRLKDENIPAFLDEHRIRLGQRWIRRLSDGVEHCKIMISVVSPASHDRPWVEKEYIMASRVEALIIPVLASEGDLPFQICDLQGLALFGEAKESNWLSLLDEIRSTLPDTSPEKQRQAETDYLNKLLQDNDDRALAFASKVYAPLAGEYRKERKRVAVAAMSPRLRHLKQTRYDEPLDPQGECTEHDDIIAAFRQHKRLVILGEPGAGKTFSLWRIAAEQAQLALSDGEQAIPVVIPLNRWDDPALLLHDFVLSQLDGLAESFDTLYQAKRILPLFDALNEIPFDQREAKLPQVREWLKNYPCEEVLLTCRKRDYRGPLEQELDRLTIEPLDPQRVYDFLHNYFGGDAAESDMADKLFWQLAGGDGIRKIWEKWKSEGYQEHWEDFWTLKEIPEEWKGEILLEGSARRACLDDPRSMIKLAGNPYLLYLMVEIYYKHQQLPESRIELFGEFVEDLIYRETEARPENHYSKADRDTLQNDLEELAWQLQCLTDSMKGVRTILSREIAEDIMPLASLEFSEAASLLDLTKDNVRFSHQLLQEFFTAQSFGERIKNGLKASDLWLPKNWWEPNGWEEAAKLAADYESNPLIFLIWLAEGNPKLAFEIARDQNLLDQKEALFSSYKAVWQAAITDVRNYPHPHERHAISTTLAWLDWDERSGIGLNELGLPDIHWLEVSAGEFIYGEKEEQQALSLDAFEVSRFPVTNRQFHAFVDAGGYENEQWWEGLQKEDELPKHRWKESNRPVENVDFYEAIAFCRWLSVETGKDIRLPTEQQWEKAARGTQGKEYPWGDEYISGYANINETWNHKKVGEFNIDETCAIGVYPLAKSPFEVMDMSGNVWEWCLNKQSETAMVTPDLSDDSRVVRGSSWGFDSQDCRATCRSFKLPQHRYYHLGFRLVCCFPPVSDH
ncbi:SUMF1/EgtB/PvdO family nonheme iron enzyme [Leucothrix arctica]|uniref:Uncharacterized protein n=1 Tax=Leucothrix arctica TaxID=1481894 RepID=A0A317CM23_9GAMM|nr:SUMF1/EgtB/PvdO family nonheme iron enzyme [Leucothrix arctica]PWQ99584.1 hypothetical protein DKT75_00505 [Leucothrix arctica]